VLNSGLSRPQEGPSSDPGQPADYWINRGLVYLVESNGVIWTRKGRASRIIGSGGPKLAPTKLGMAMGFGTTYGTGTTDRIDGQTLARSAGFRSIVSFSYAVGTGGGGFGRISQPTGTTGAAADDEAWYINGTTSKFQYNRQNSAGTGGAWHIAGAAVTGAWKCYGVTHDQTAVGNTPALYEDGKLATTTVINASTVSYSVAAYTPTFGNRSTDSARGWDGLLGPQIIFDHPYAGLTAAEHKWLFEDPARIYETPPVRVNWFAQVAAGVHSTSGALTGQGSTVAGTAAHIAKHATSGALTGPGSTVAGTAARTRAHPTSGALSGPGAVVAGTAARTSPGIHATTGALIGQGAVVVGTAAHIAKHATSGALVGPGATLAGTAARVAGAVTHATSGALVGAGSVLVATARNGLAAGRRKTSQRKILVTIKGARFLVPEDQLDEWLEDKEDEIVEQAVKPVAIVTKKARIVRPNTLPVPKVATPVDDEWVKRAIAVLNERVQQRITQERRRVQDEDDEEVMLLLL